MKRKAGTPLQEFKLPEGYTFKGYKAGDEPDWVRIERSVDELTSSERALPYFINNYVSYKGELERRCLFVENPEGMKVATLTIWWGYTGLRRDPWLHWFSVMPEYQNKAIGKALLYEQMIRLLLIEGDRDVYIPTQTWSYKAINIYRKQEFVPTDEQGLGGYENKDYKLAMELIKGYMR
jgi:GNAT superfamily N-acetyltransferase